MRIFKFERPSPALVISILALFVALGGTAAAIKLKRNSVGSKQIRANAVKGSEAAENTFGQVPRSNRSNLATRATTATNAGAIDGIDSDFLQFGDGFDDGYAALVADTESDFNDIGSGTLNVTCDAGAGAETIDYDDASGDSFDTDVWRNGAHTDVSDGDTGVNLVSSDATSGITAQIQVWGGFGDDTGAVDIVHVSVFDDGTECRVAFNSQTNTDE